MTKEENIKNLKKIKTVGLCKRYLSSIDEAIKALEQPTSDDCVSRAEVLKQMKEWRDYEFVKMTNPYYYLEKRIQSMPPVTPTFPKGTTNGDIIKIIFPNIEANEVKTDTGGYIEVKYLDTTDKCDATAFRKNWWNAPYKRGDIDGSN